MSTILHINKFFYRKGGSEAYFFSVMQELQKRGHTVVPFSMQDDRNLPSAYSAYFAPGISFDSDRSIKKAAHFIFSKEAQRSLERLLREVKPEIAHLHNFAHQLTPSIITTLKKHHIPIVYTAHDYQLICPNYQLYTQNAPCERCHVFKYWNAVTHACVRNSVPESALAAIEMTVNRKFMGYYNDIDRIIAPSQFLFEMLKKWKYSERQLRYIPHGVVHDTRSHSTSKGYLLYVGRLVREKGVATLLRAMLMNAETLHIVGTGPEESHLRAQVHELGIEDRVSFFSQQSTEQVADQMNGARVLVVPSEWYENAPMVIYEALSKGLPVVGSRIGGISELIIEGKNGYTCLPKDPFSLAQAILQAKALSLDIMPKFQYSIELHMDRIEALYAECIQK